MRQNGINGTSVKAFLKTEALLKYTAPRAIQSRDDRVKILFSPELSEF